MTVVGMDQPTSGFLLMDKDGGWTSHDVVAKVRSITEQRKVGHAGTLDPMATGLLVLGIGKATRLLRFVQAGLKEYVARVSFGVATDSLDADGAVLSREPMPVSETDVSAAAERFVGTVMQEPPMVSARKVEGRRLYELAREGKEVAREARPVEIRSIEVEDFAPSDYPEAVLRVTCGTGTYVRTLADDIARALGGRAHLSALRRTRNGSLSVDDAVTIEELRAAEHWSDHALSLADGLPDMPEAPVGDDQVTAVTNGVALTGRLVEQAPEGLVRVTAPDGRLLAVYSHAGAVARPEVVVA